MQHLHLGWTGWDPLVWGSEEGKSAPFIPHWIPSAEQGWELSGNRSSAGLGALSCTWGLQGLSWTLPKGAQSVLQAGEGQVQSQWCHQEPVPISPHHSCFVVGTQP